MALALAAAAFAWNVREDQRLLERELVKRQSEAQTQVVEARALARAAEESARDAQVKSTLLESRLAEATAQRSQLESLMLTLSRSRDENAVADIEALVRAAMSQSLWTGRTEPLMTALKQTDERLAAMQTPRLTALRKAVARDVDRLGAASTVDAAATAQRIDELLSQVDDLALTIQVGARPSAAAASVPQGRAASSVGRAQPKAPKAAPAPVTADDATGAPTLSPPSSPSSVGAWRDALQSYWVTWKDSVVQEFRGLVRISRIDQPSAMLIAPEQAYFVRENLRLRLLSARLAVQSRQHDMAQRDLREAVKLIDAYFDRQSPRVVAARSALGALQSATQAPPLPRPEETLTALALLSKTK